MYCRNLSWLPRALLNLNVEDCTLGSEAALPSLPCLRSLDMGPGSVLPDISAAANMERLSLSAVNTSAFQAVLSTLERFEHLAAVHIWWDGIGKGNKFELASSNLSLPAGCSLMISHRTKNITEVLPPRRCLPMLNIIKLHEHEDPLWVRDTSRHDIDLSPLQSCPNLVGLCLSCVAFSQVHLTNLHCMPAGAVVVVQCTKEEPLPPPPHGWNLSIYDRDADGGWLAIELCRV